MTYLDSRGCFGSRYQKKDVISAEIGSLGNGGLANGTFVRVAGKLVYTLEEKITAISPFSGLNTAVVSVPSFFLLDTAGSAVGVRPRLLHGSIFRGHAGQGVVVIGTLKYEDNVPCLRRAEVFGPI